MRVNDPNGVAEGAGTVAYSAHARKVNFVVSSVLLRLLDLALVTPERLDRSMSARLRRGMGGMTARDHFPKLIGRAASVRVHAITRRNRHILVEFARPGCLYAERGRSATSFFCVGNLPETVLHAVPGRRVGELIGPGRTADLIGPAAIRSVAGAWENTFALDLDPGWRTFSR